MKLRTVLFTLLGATLTGVGFAQATNVTFRPALIDTFASSYSYSDAGAFKRNDAIIKGVSMIRFEFSAIGRVPIAEETLFNPGLSYSNIVIDTPDNTALPKSVQEFSVNLGIRGKMSQQWAYVVTVRPGIYGDFEKIRSDSFNAPLFLAAFFVPNDYVTWIVGVSANSFNNHPVLPVTGLRLKLASNLQFELGFPRTGLSYAYNSSFTFRGGLSVFGGNYRITKDLGVPAPGIKSLNNTYFDLTEIRSGFGVTYRLNNDFELEADYGYTLMRRFEFPDRHYRLQGENVSWLSVALNVRF